jgi:hypothetical protein
MLSLLGSIQFDPFSPEHVPEMELSRSSSTMIEQWLDGTADNNDSDTNMRSGRREDKVPVNPVKRKASRGEPNIKEKKRKTKKTSKTRQT